MTAKQNSYCTAAIKASFIMIFISSLMGNIKVPFLKYGVYDYLLPFFALVLIILNLDRLKTTLKYHRQTLTALLMLYIWMWVSTLFSDFQGIALKYSIKYTIYIIIFFSFLLITHNNHERYLYYRLGFRFLLFLCIFGIIEFFLPDMWLIKLLRIPDSLLVYPRISSLLQWPNQFGVLMSIGALMSFFLYKEKAISRVEFSLSTLMFIIATSLSASRGGWLVLIAGVFLAWLYRAVKLRGAIAIIGLLTFFILLFPVSTMQSGLKSNNLFPLLNFLIPTNEQSPNDNTIQAGLDKKIDTQSSFIIKKIEATSSLEGASPSSTLSSRLILWNIAKEEFTKNPVTGLGIQAFNCLIGPDIVPDAKHNTHNTHNIFLNILVELGFPGMILSLIFIYRLYQRTDLTNPAVCVPVVMIFTGQLFDFYLHDFTFTIFSLLCLATAGNSLRHEN